MTLKNVKLLHDLYYYFVLFLGDNFITECMMLHVKNGVQMWQYM